MPQARWERLALQGRRETREIEANQVLGVDPATKETKVHLDPLGSGETLDRQYVVEDRYHLAMMIRGRGILRPLSLSLSCTLQGISGQSGEAGPKGDIGPPGDPGPTGPNGRDGNAGQNGAPGERGQKGNSGPVGAQVSQSISL